MPLLTAIDLFTGVFVAASLGGVGYEEGVTTSSQLFTRFIGVVATVIWCGGVSFIILEVLDVVEEETEGLDIVMHNETGYNL